jgi:hypothetical protein
MIGTHLTASKDTLLMLSNFAEIDFAALPSIEDGAARAHRVPKVVASAESLRGYANDAWSIPLDR